MSEDLYGPGISDENEVATILEIKATIAPILIKFDSVSLACNDGKETSVARLEFSYFRLFSPSCRRYGRAELASGVTMQNNFDMRRLRLKNRRFDGKRATKIEVRRYPNRDICHVVSSLWPP